MIFVIDDVNSGEQLFSSESFEETFRKVSSLISVPVTVIDKEEYAKRLESLFDSFKIDILA